MPSEFPRYTDMQQRTRIIDRPGRVSPGHDAIGSTQLIPKKEGLLDGLSIPQVIASACAAATSMLLASKIGIAGSVIGAAVSSVVTIVATQLYRRALNAGARKLQQAAIASPAQADPRDPYGIGSRMPAADPVAQAPARGARIAPTKLQARAAAQRASLQRKVTAASIGVALITVTLVAAAILMGTGGDGLGTKPAPLLSRRPAATEPQDAGAGDAAAGDKEGAQSSQQPSVGAPESQDAQGQQDGAAPSPTPDAQAPDGETEAGGADGQQGQGSGTTDGGGATDENGGQAGGASGSIAGTDGTATGSQGPQGAQAKY